MIVGEVISSDAGCFQWTIHDFLSHVWRKTVSLYSPDFMFSEASYYIKLEFSGNGLIALKFAARGRLDSDSSDSDSCNSDSCDLKVKIGMRTGHRGKLENRSGEVGDGGIFEVAAWMGISEFFERRCEILTDGLLAVFCELRRMDTEESAAVLLGKLPSEGKAKIKNEAFESDSDEEETDPEGKSVKNLQKDLKNLLISGEDCDVTIKVKGKDFPVHRNFLRARSAVFKSMFSHEMVEKQNGVVVIDDCDPDTFPDFLNYVYTGSTKYISDENVFSLYAAGDKYRVKGLKEECAAFMKRNITVRTFCDTITLAVRHTQKELIDLATEFFCANVAEIAKTAKWQTFLSENSTVGNELFLKAFSKKI